MEEILYLEPDEEITSVIDKVKKTQSDSVGLVIPRNSGLIHSIVNLKLLKKEAATHKKEIALVTADKIGKNIATQVGIPVFEDVHSKRPVNNFSMGDLPKADEVIEVDMSSGHIPQASDEGKASSEPKVKYYGQDSKDEQKSKKTKKPEPEVVIDGADEDVREHEMAKASTQEDLSASSDEISDEMTDENLITDSADSEDTVDEEDHEPYRPTKSAFVTAVKKTPTYDEPTDQPERSYRHHESYDTPIPNKRGSHRDQTSSSKKGLVFSILAVILIIAAILLGLPQASVAVTVAAENFEKTNTITVDATAKQADASKATVPGRLLSADASDAKRVPTTGKKDIGEKAKGTVTLYNAWDGNPIKFTVGTNLTTSDGKVYQLSQDITVPGGTATLVNGQLTVNPGKIDASAVASNNGDAYNIPPAHFTISGVVADRQSKIYGDSSKPFTGGTSKTVAVMTQQDIDNAKSSMISDLTKTATDQLKKDAKTDTLIDDAVVMSTSNVSTNPSAPDSQADYFDIKVTVKNQVMVFDSKTMNALVTQLLKQQVPTGKELLLSDADEFDLSTDKADYQNNILSLSSKVKTKVGTRIDAGSIKKQITGKSQSAVKAQLESIPNFKDVEVHTYPNWWWQATSFFPWNTRVKVLYE